MSGSARPSGYGLNALNRGKAGRERTLVTPEGLALPITLGSRGARVGALLLDLVIINGGLFLFLLVLVLLVGSLVDIDALENSTLGEFLIVILILVMFAARYFYFLAQELGPRGATIGKRAAGLRIAARDGGRLTAEAVIARNLLRELELFMPLAIGFSGFLGQGGLAGFSAAAWFLLFMLLPVFNKDRLRAGDIVAGTWVVEAPRMKLADALSSGEGAKGRSTVTGAEYKFGEAELSVYGEYELQTLERVLRRSDAESLAEVHKTICEKIGWNAGSGDERAFLEAFYAQLRARLERGMQLGDRKADKFS